MSILKDHIIRYGSSVSIGNARNLGGSIDLASPLPDTAILASLWDHVTVDEAESGKTEFRCFYLKNTHPTASILNPIFVVQKDTTSSSDFISVGWGLSAVNTPEQSIATESTYPNNVTFYSGSTPGTGAILGRDIPPGKFKAVWLRRTVNFNAQRQINDAYTIRLLTDNISEEISDTGDIPNPSPTTSVVVVGQTGGGSTTQTGGTGGNISSVVVGVQGSTDAQAIINQTNAWIANLFLELGLGDISL
jgi:hypothetical protein